MTLNRTKTTLKKSSYIDFFTHGGLLSVHRQWFFVNPNVSSMYFEFSFYMTAALNATLLFVSLKLLFIMFPAFVKFYFCTFATSILLSDSQGWHLPLARLKKTETKKGRKSKHSACTVVFLSIKSKICIQSSEEKQSYSWKLLFSPLLCFHNFKGLCYFL